MSSDAIITEIDLNDLKDRAAAAGNKAYAETRDRIGDAGAAGFVAVHIPVNIKHRPLIRELAEWSIGQFDAWRCDYKIDANGHAVAGNGQRVQSISVQEAAAEAYVAVLREAGFEPTINSVLD